MCIPVEQAERIWRDLESLKVAVDEIDNLEQQVQAFQSETANLRTALEFSEKEAGAQRAISGIKEREIEACRNTAFALQSEHKRKLWAHKAIIAGEAVLIGVLLFIAAK